MSRKLNIGTSDYTEVICEDEPGLGGASHKYLIRTKIGQKELSSISFQKGPIKENLINGCHHEDLIAIVIDRLEHYQKGDFKCEDNEIALTMLKGALGTLRLRTFKRKERGVEGTSTV